MHPNELTKIIYAAMDEKMAQNVRILSVDKITSLTERFVICSGRSTTHIRAIADGIEEKTALAGNPPHRIEGYISANWILLDFGSVIVHIFHQETREFYSLEKLWTDATVIAPENL